MNEAIEAAHRDLVVRVTSWCFRQPWPEGRVFDAAWNALVWIEEQRFAFVLARHRGVSGS